MEKIFLTGGTGFVGSYFLRKAKTYGLNVRAQRRFGSYTRISLPTEPDWINVSLDEIQVVHLRGCDVLVHLASAGVSPQPASWAELFYWNVQSVHRLIIKAVEAGIRRIVICGTYAEYGSSGERFNFIPPNAPLEPVLPYAASKSACYMIARALCVEYQFEMIYPRLFSAFGIGQHESNFWPQLRAAALRGDNFQMTRGMQVRDFISVENAVEQLIEACVVSGINPGRPRVFNLASGNPTTLINFANEWWEKFNASGRLEAGALDYRRNEVMRFVPLVGEYYE